MTNNNGKLHIVLQKTDPAAESLAIPEKVELLSALARQAATKSAALSGLELTEFPKNEKGAPLPLNGVYWSLTHKPLYVGGAAALQPLGIDLEMKRPIAMKIFDRVALGKEWQLAINAGLDSRRAFFMFWTAKEALLKRLGLGLSKGLAACEIEAVNDDCEVTLSCKGQSFRVRYFDFDGHLAAVCADYEEICWHLQP